MTEIDLFLSHLQSEDLASGTIANYGGNLRMFARWVTAQAKTLPTLTPADMKQYKAELKDRYKPATVNTKLACVSMLFRWCLKNGHINENPMIKIKTVKAERYSRWLTQGQVEAIITASKTAIEQAQAKQLNYRLTVTLRQYAIAVILLNTGLRVSELCDLHLGDVKNEIVTVRWGKGGKRREVPMNEQAIAALDLWLEARNSKSDYLFPTKGRMKRQLVEFHLSELGKRLGFRLTPHLLRHTFGKNLADKGIPLDRIAKLMGHSDINTTAIYTMPSLEDLRQAVKLLD